MSEEVVISGIAGRLPESENIEVFWNNLVDGVDMVNEINPRYPIGYLGLPSRMGKIRNLERFDAEFFGVQDKDADEIEPQARIAYETMYEALMDAGINPETLRGSNTGLYIGSCDNDTASAQREDTSDPIPFVQRDCERLAYAFDFRGPVALFDTACASSFSAMNEAFRAVRTGVCDQAIVSGFALHMAPHASIFFHNTQMTSSDGKSKSLDASADGYVRSEAIISLIIQRRSQAKRIYAEIVNSKTNTDGYKLEGVTFPKVDTQTKLMKEVYQEANIDPSDLPYMEAHLTGTPVGDPVEAQAIMNVCGVNRKKPLLIGAMKSNMGHAEGASGVAATIKACLAFQHEELPPNLHYKTANPAIEGLVNGTLKPVLERMPFKEDIIGLNSFGFGGVNVHTVLRANRKRTQNSDLPKLVPICGRTRDSVMASFDYLERNHSKITDDFIALAEEAMTIKPRAGGMCERGFAILNSPNSPTIKTHSTIKHERPVWCIFSGLGSQWRPMAKHLMSLKAFADSIESCHKIALKLRMDLLAYLTTDIKIRIGSGEVLVGITSMQIALFDLLRSLGIEFKGFIGHSLGEVAAAYADGALTKEEALETSYILGNLTSQLLKKKGSMIATDLTWKEAVERCTQSIPRNVYPACHNGSESVTITGLSEDIERLAAELLKEGRLVAKVDTSGIPYHCPIVEPTCSKIERALAKVIRRPKSSEKWITCSTSATESQVADSVYFSNMVVNQVRFFETFQRLPKDAAVIEIGPHSLFMSQLKEFNSSLACIPMMKKNSEQNLEMVLSAIGHLYNCGQNPKITKLYPAIKWPVGRETLSISPLIKWNHEREWKVYKFPQSFNIAARSPQFTIDTTTQKFKFLLGHTIDGRVLFPATGYLGLAWQFLAQNMAYSSQYDVSVEFQNVKFHRATILSKTGPTTFEVSFNPQTDEFAIEESGAVCCSGIVRALEKELPAILNNDEKFPTISDAIKLQNKDIYKELRVRGYDYGPSFQGLVEASVDGTWGRVKWPGNWIAFADTVLQLIILPIPYRELFVPTFIEYIACDIKTLLDEIQKNKNDENESILTVKANPDAKFISTTGFVMKGLKANAIPRRLNLANASLEAHKFYPYDDVLEATSKQMASIENYTKLCEALWNKIDKKEPIEQKVQEEIDAMTSEPKHLVLNQLNQIAKMEENGVPLITKLKEALLNQESFTADLLNALAFESEPFCRPMVETIVENFNVKTPKIAEFHFKKATQLSDRLFEALDMAHIRYEKSNYSFDVDASKIQNNSLHLVLIHDPAYDTLKISHNKLQELLEKINDKLTEGCLILIVYREKLMSLEQKIINLIHDETPPMSSLTNGLNLINLARRSFNETHGLLILRKPTSLSSSDRVVINVTNDNYNWVNEIKTNIYDEKEIKRIWLLSKDMDCSGILGFVNCIRKEGGREKIRCLFGSDQLTDDILDKDLVNNVFKSGIHGRYQHELITTSNKPKSSKHAYLNVAAKGDLTSLKWFESPDKYWRPSSKSKLFNIHYSALNFKDVMVATGRIPIDAYPFGYMSDGALGMEFSGTDENGNRIMGFHSTNCIASTVEIEDVSFLWPIPKHWSMEEAATVPVAYTTIYYALLIRGRLRPGETVLIHAGSGGVGQAAISVCFSMGCNVYTTVGSQAKRDFLLKRFPKLKNDHIGNSRDLSFEEMVLKATNGRGVDIVLNSLAEEKFKASVNCLASGGRFIEIGKYDLVQNTKLDFSLFVDKEYHAVCVAHLSHDAYVLRTPSALALCDRIKEMLLKGVESGEVEPLPYHMFSKEKCEEAFRFMASGKHTGKVLIEIRPEETSEFSIEAQPRTYFDPSKSYLITGGLGGFGLEIADWLVRRGANKIMLTSRRGITTQYQQYIIDRFHSKQVDVQIIINDLLSEESTKELISQANKVAPLGGIFHLAMVLNDAAFENMTPELFEQVCAAKVNGTMYLDKISREKCPKLDYFVCFSSVACGRGNAGQTNYGFANSAMERICEKRKEDGLHGLAIQWGAIGDVGVIAEHYGGNDVVIGNTVPQRIPSCLEVLSRFLHSDEAVVSSICHVDKGNSLSSKKGLFLQLCHVLGITDPASVSDDATLHSLGLDSLMAVEIKQVLEQEYDLHFTSKEIRALTIKQVKQMEEQQKINQKRRDSAKSIEDERFKFSFVPPKETFVELNSGSEGGRPIFMFPPLEGNFGLLWPLVMQVPRLVIGVNWVEDLDQLESIADIAAFYVKKIREAYPDTQYDFIGYSFGGLVALEMASQMQTQFGEHIIRKILLLDSSPLYQKAAVTNVAARHEAGIDKKSRIQILVGFVTLFYDLDMSEQMQLKEIINSCEDDQEGVKLLSEFLLKEKGIEADPSNLFKTADRYFRKCIRIVRYDCKKQFNIDCYLLRATEVGYDKNSQFDIDETYGLSKIINGKLEYLTLNGDHRSFLNENAKEISEIIDSYFLFYAVA